MRTNFSTFNLSHHFNKKIGLMLIGNFLTILINILTVKFLTNKFSTYEYGYYTLIISFSSLPQLVLYAPIASVIFPFIKNKKDSNNYINLQRDVFNLLFFVTSIIFVFIGVIFFFNAVYQFVSNELLFIGLLTLIFSSSLSFLSTLDTFSLANNRIKEYTIFPIINVLFKLLLIIVFLKVKINPYSLIILFSCCHIILSLIEFLYLKKKCVLTYSLKFKIKDIFEIFTKEKKEIFSYSKNFFIWGIFGWSQTFFDKWFLQHYVNTSSVGIYAVYYQYGFFPFTVFSSVISQYITPIYFTKLHEQKHTSFLKKLLTYSFYFLLITLVLTGIISFYLAPFLIKTLTNESYLTYIKLFPIMVLSGCFYGYGQIITVPLLNTDFVSKIRLPKILTAVISMLLFWILIPIFGVLGILIALLVSNLFYFVSLFIINWRYYKLLIKKAD